MHSAVSEKAFDEYHLYTLERAATLLDRETKQVEFVRATGVKSRVLYVYDGAQIDNNRYNGWGLENIRNDSEYGTQSNPKVWVMREFSNAAIQPSGHAAAQGPRCAFIAAMPTAKWNLPGKTPSTTRRATRSSGSPPGTLSTWSVNASAPISNMDDGPKMMDESFEIKLRNHKKEAAEIRVVEHLYRWDNWEIRAKSDDFIKTDSQTMEFRVPVPAGGEKTVTYTVHYSW